MQAGSASGARSRKARAGAGDRPGGHDGGRGRLPTASASMISPVTAGDSEKSSAQSTKGVLADIWASDL